MEAKSSSSNLAPLPEENPASVFSSKPIRPPTQISSEKYSPLDWKGYFDQEDDVSIPHSNDVFHVYTAGKEGPVVFCLHGGGYSGLSFAISTRVIKEKARVVAMDLRGHGKSSTENEVDMSIETLCNDVQAVVKTMYGDSPPAIVLVGHSMGGSVAVHLAAKKMLPSLAGLVVVDVVEGTAMASLMHMQKILSNRMQYFPSLEKAIEWNVRGGSLRNIESARISIPGTVTYDDSQQCYRHRARLEETEQYWRGWYEGLSEKFLSSPVPKLLLLAGTDRLDRALTIGQMQGKFQMIVVRHTGHAIQEDVPDEFATLILNFVSRNRIGPHGVENRMIEIREEQQGNEEQLTDEQIVARVLGTKRGFNPGRGRVLRGSSSSSSSVRSHPAPAPPLTQSQMAAMAKYATATQQHVMNLHEHLAARNIIDLP